MATTTSFAKSHRARHAVFTLTYADTTSAEMFKLPKNATILDWTVNVQTAFSGGTTELDVGLSSDADYFLDAVSIGTAGKVTLTTKVAQPGHKTSAITSVYASVGASNTAGQVQVICTYTLDIDRRF